MEFVEEFGFELIDLGVGEVNGVVDVFEFGLELGFFLLGVGVSVESGGLELVKFVEGWSDSLAEHKVFAKGGTGFAELDIFVIEDFLLNFFEGFGEDVGDVLDFGEEFAGFLVEGADFDGAGGEELVFIKAELA